MSSAAGSDRPPPRIRERPEDFVVEEIPLYPPSGEGAHTFLWIEKRGVTSEQVARALARAAGVRARDVGYAGRKDRGSIARQHFSVPGLDPPAALALELPGARVLRAVAHPHKLRTAQLRGNRFDLIVRGVGASALGRATAEVERVIRVGLPNRFGTQRYGRGHDNAVRGRALLLGRERAPGRAARFLISALQAQVFDEVLRRRPLPLDRVERGDLAKRTDSGGLFRVEDEEADNARAQRFEISATGPIFGLRVERPGGAVAEREAAVLQDLEVPEPDAWRLPRGLRLRGARRPLRVPVRELRLEAEDDRLRVHCVLPAGSYATVLLEELLGVAPHDASG